MKIACEHCGTLVDTNKDKVCPNCGASISGTKDYKEYKEYKKKNMDYDLREREANIHSKEMANKMVENGMKAGKGIGIFVVFFFILTFGIIFTIIGKGFFSHFGGGKYEISCDEVKLAEETIFDDFEKKNDGSNYYSFHIIFKNLDGEWYNMNDINVTYTDNNGNEGVIAKKHTFGISENSLNGFAKEKLTYSGYLTYEIPDYVKDVDIVFKDSKYSMKDFKENILE